MNLLSAETSPYLLQHAGNPVHWMPWNELAFEKAKAENKPVFLSIGYSTCHWCHVMAHESFEDDEVAAVLNEHFVCIKVDREERPDIDQVYMTACQLMSGSGGWPLTVVLTPDKLPFFAGTYYPKQSKPNRIGLLQLLPRIIEAWNEDPEWVKQNQKEWLLHVSSLNAVHNQDTSLDVASVHHNAFAQLENDFDSVHGGFGNHAKFPTAHHVLFLMRYGTKYQNQKALEMVTKTLTNMRYGGLFDAVGFGFHRYSTDPFWHLPHFEKMLYDQAFLLMAYVEAYQCFKDPLYLQTAEHIANFVNTHLKAPNGGFYSAYDADSEGKEGTFYTWTYAEIEALLDDKADMNWLSELFALDKNGNWSDESTGHREPTNIFHQQLSWQQLAEKLGRSAEALEARWEHIRLRLYAHRETRVKPHLDDKLCTDWNAMWVVALAKLAKVTQNAELVLLTKNTIHWLWTHAFDQGKAILHSQCKGVVSKAGFASDAAYGIWALTLVYELTDDSKYLNQAKQLIELTYSLFCKPNGSLTFGSAQKTDLPVQLSETLDGAIPSANAALFNGLIQLWQLCGESDYFEKAKALVGQQAAFLNRYPSAFTGWLMGSFGWGEEPHFLTIQAPTQTDMEPWMSWLNQTFIFETKLKKEVGCSIIQTQLCSFTACKASYSSLDELKEAYLNHAFN